MERLRARSKAFDAAKYLETDEDIAECLADAVARSDAESTAQKAETRSKAG